MKPLSYLNYLSNNKRKVVSSMLAIVITIIFLYVIECFGDSIMSTAKALFTKSAAAQIVVLPTSSMPQIPQDVIDSVKNDEGVERVLPVQPLYTTFSVPGSSNSAAVDGIRPADVNYFLQKHNTTLFQGRLPEQDKAEIALDSRVALNKNLKIGDQVGSEVDPNIYETLPGRYTVVGILKGGDYVSLSSYNTANISGNALQNGLIVIPKQGDYTTLDDKLSVLTKRSLDVSTLSILNDELNSEAGSMQVLDMICLIAILVMVVCLVCAKYAQFYNRKAEYGILAAMGYSRAKLIGRATAEVAITNFICFIIGTALAILNAKQITGRLFTGVGGIGVFLDSKAFIVAILTPLFTTLFTLIPIYRLLGSIDPITLIEQN